jgi:hypothetical protein
MNILIYDNDLIDGELTQVEFDEAIDGLLEKGVIETFILNGEVDYRLTAFGKQIAPHMDSNKKNQN